MPSFSHQTHNRFAVEGLESRILLSAVPMDAMMEVEEAPDVYEVQYVAAAEQTAVPSSESQDSLWMGASALQEGGAEIPALLTITPGGVLDASGQWLQALEAGTTLVATEIHIADGTILESVSLRAETITLGAVTWSGASHLDATELQVIGAQTALSGASLLLTPSADDAPIFLGVAVDGVDFGLDEQALSLLSAAELDHLTIGSASGSHLFFIDGLEFEGDLTLQASQGVGSFMVLSEVLHSGGTLTYIGTGTTQFTSADTLLEGTPLTVDDSVELVYVAPTPAAGGNPATPGNLNTIRIDTTHNGNPDGADITIDGSIRGSDEGGGGHLILNAGSNGIIRITGNIGTAKALERITIENAAQVIIEGNIQVEAFVIQSGTGDVILGTDAPNFVNIKGLNANTGVFTTRTASNIIINGDFEMVNGDAIFEITGAAGTRQLWIKGEVDVDDGNLTIERANRVLMSNDVVVSGVLSQLVGFDNTRFEANVSAGSITLNAINQIRFEGDVLLLSGDLTLVTNNIDFRGGNATVGGALDQAGLSISDAFFRPATASDEMNIGSPLGAGSNFTFSATDIIALENGWNSITFGYDTGSTNLARIGTATFLDAVIVHAGSMLVNGPLGARSSLTLDAATGDLEFTNSALVTVVNEQISNVWQTSFVEMTADQGDILFSDGASTLISNSTDLGTETPASTITMTATLGDIRDQSATPGFQQARDIDLTASGDIVLYTRTENLWAESTVEGAIEIFELDGVRAHSLVTADGLIELDTGGLTQVDLAQSSTDDANNTIFVSALDSILVGEILAGDQGDVSLTAQGSITRISGLADADHRIVADQLTLSAETGIGEIAAPILIRTNGLDGENLNEGNIRITHDGQRDALTVRLENFSSVDGDLVSLDVLDANVTVTSLSNQSDGGVYLDVVGDFLLTGAFASAGGTVRVTPSGTAELAVGSSISSDGGDVALTAQASLTMATDAQVVSSGGAILLSSTGDILLGTADARDDASAPGIQSTWGDVALIAGGWLRDHTGSGAVNVYANELHLSAQTGIGQLPDLGSEQTIELDASLVAAELGTSGDIVLHAIGDLTTGVLQAFTFDQLDVNGAIQAGALSVSPLAGILNNDSVGGNILLSAVGSLTLKSNELATDASAVATVAAGNVVLVAQQLTVEDSILSNGGSISADVVDAITLEAEVSVATSGVGTIALRSSADSIVAAADSRLVTDDTAIVLSAQNNIELGSASALGGAVGLTAVTGSVRAAAGGVDVRTVVEADTLAIIAGGEVDGPLASAERFRVSVNTLSLTGGTGSGYRIDNDQSLLIDTTSATAELFDRFMAAGSLALAAQSDFVVSGEGTIDLNVQGELTLAGARDLSTTGAGTIDLVLSGGLTMAALSLIETENGAIDVTAGETISVAQIASTDGDIRIETENGAIIDSDPTETTVVDFSTLGQLTLIAADGIGIESGQRDTLSVAIGSLTATTVDGGIFVSSTDSFVINGVLASGTLAPVIITSQGSLTIENSVDATGDVILRADVNLTQAEAGLIVAGSNIALQAGADMTLFRVQTPAAVALEVTGALTGYADPAQAAIQANALLLNGVGSVGTLSQALLTNVERLAGLVTEGALALVNESDLTIGAVTVASTLVGTADTLPLAPRVQSGDRLLVNGTGTGIFIEVDGSFTTESVTDASLETMSALPVLVASTAGQIWNGRFTLAGGVVTLRAGDSVTLDASDTFSTADGSLLIESLGQFTLGDSSVLDRGAGDLIVDAAGNILLAGQIIGAGDAALLSGDAILVGAGNSLQATDLILSSNQGIASSSQSLVADVDRLAVRTGASGVFLQNSGALSISNLGFGLVSLAPGGIENAAFSGFAGGVVAAQGGQIEIDSQGALTIEPIAASVDALPGTDLAFSLIADEAGSAGNGISVFIVRGDPPAPANPGDIPEIFDYSSEDRSLTIYMEDVIYTVGEIVDIINNHPEFPGQVVLAGGLVDGSTVFNLPALELSTFATTVGGSEDGLRSEIAGILAEGAEPIASSAQLLVPDNFFTIRITSDTPGASINNVTVRLLNEGPLEVADGGRLNPGTNAALVEWDGSDFLDVYVNFGFTTVGTVINRINEQVGIPFSAQLGGTFDTDSTEVVLGDAPVLMESNLRASAILRPIGSNNDFQVTASDSGPLFNGINFLFLDDGTLPVDGAEAIFNPITNLMTLRIQSGVTTTSQVISALNAQGTFTATLVPELNNLNSGNGPVHAQRFLTVGGAVAVQASAVLRMVGANNDVTLTANDLGDDFNNIEIRLVSNTAASPGSVVVNYDSALERLTLTVNPLFTSAAQVVDAINQANTPFTATSNGSGTFAMAQYPPTSGGTGAAARAEVIAAGANNDFEIIANSASTALINTRVFLIDDASIDDGTAIATYLSGPRHLIVRLQSGVTTANDVLAAINAASIPMTAALLSGNDGSGVYQVDAAVFAGGTDPISATSTVVLPSGAVVTVVADEGGIAANGIQVAFAIDASLVANSAALGWFEMGGKRILQLRVDSASTELSVIAAALAADASIPFTLSGDLSASVGDLAPMAGAFNEGTIALTAEGAISLLGRIDSQTGRVLLVSTNGDLTFDSETARIEAIDGVDLDFAGNFANLASLEAPLIRVYGESGLSITTGSQSLVSTESVYLLSGGDLAINGAGFAVEDSFVRDQSIRLVAENDLLIDAPVRAVAASIDADGTIFTVIKSEVDGDDNPLSVATPVAIEENGGNYTVYVLPEVATHASIIDAINALEIDELSVFFANLGRQDGALVIGEHTFFITSLTAAVIQNVAITFTDSANAPVEASFAGTTLTLLLDAADDATVEDLLRALNGLGAFAATTPTIDISSFLRGAAARDFQSDYSIEIVADAAQVPPVVLEESGDTFTLTARPGVATRMDLLNALTASGLFAGSVPALDARLEIDGFTFFLNTSETLTSVSLQVGFVEEGTLAATFDEVAGALEITLDNVDAASGQDLRDALEALGFIVFSLASDLSAAIDTDAAVADLDLIAAATRTAPLALNSPITVTLPVASEGVFADVLFEVEGMLIALNWLVPVVASDYTIATFDDSLSSSIVDDASSPAATLSYGSPGVFASTILTVDGVDIAIAARSAGLILSAGNDLNITSNGLLGGGTVDAEAGNLLVIAGTVEGGNIDLVAINSVSQSGTIQATGTGAINVISREGAISMAGSAATTSVSGPIFYQAAGSVAIVSIASTDAGRIDVVTEAAITDALVSNALNISTDGFVALSAQTGIGAVGAAAINTASGSIQLRNFGTAGDIVVAEATSGETLTVRELTQNAASGWSILSAAQGDVIFTGAVFHLSDGALRVQATDSIITESDAPIVLNGGLLTFLAGDSIALNADLATGGGDAWLAAANGSLAMLPAITLNAGSGNVLLRADQNVTVAQVLSSESVRVESTNGSILRAALNQRTNLLASSLQLRAGLNVGSLATSEGALITEVGVINATAADGVLAVRELDDLTIGQSSIAINFAQASRTSSSADFDASQWSQSGNGDSALRVGGSLTVESIPSTLPTVAVAGNLHVNVVGAVTVNGAVDLTDGSLQWLAGGSFNLNADLNVVGGTLLLQAGAAFIQAAAAVVTVDDANAVIESGAAMTVGSINLGSGALALTASGALVQLSDQLIEASQIRLSAGANIASAADPFTFETDRISALAGGAMFLDSASALGIDTVAAIDVDTVTLLGAIGVAYTAAAQSDLRTTANNGAIILSLDAGDLTLNGGLAGSNGNTAVSAHGSGNILLNTPGQLVANADVRSGSGHITVLAAGDVVFNASADIATTAAATLSIQSVTGAISMDDNTQFITDSGDIVLQAAQGITLGGIRTSGSVALFATAGSILDAGDTYRDVIAGGLLLNAGAGIGTNTNPLDISVTTVSARAANGGIFLSESNDLTVGDVSATVARVAQSSLTVSTPIAAQSDLRTLAGNGSIIVQLAAGNLVLNDGTALADGTTVVANGSGNILLQTLSGNFTANADILSAGGDISLRSTGSMLLSDNLSVTTSGSGSLTLIATAGTLTQNTGGTLTAADGDIILEASGSISIAGIVTNANVGIVSTAGSLIDNQSARTNVLADSLQLRAAQSIGSGSNPLETEVNALSAFAQGGGIFLAEVDAISVTATAAQTSVVQANNSTELKTLASLSGLTAASSGAIVLVNDSGNITVAVDNAITAPVNGNVLLNAADDLIIQSNITSGAGNITLVAANDFTLAADRTVTTGVAGEIHVIAGGALDAIANSRFINGTGNVLLSAADDITLSGVQSTGRVAITSSDGSILAAGSDAYVREVIASQLLLSAANGAIGSAVIGQTLQTQVGRIAAESLNGVYLTNAAGLRVDAVTVPYRTVNADGSLATSASITEAGAILATAADREIRLTVETQNLTLGLLSAESVYVNVLAGSILDGDYAALQIIATNAELIAASSIGTAGNAKLNTQIENLAASAGTSLVLSNDSDLTIGTVGGTTGLTANNVLLVEADGAINLNEAFTSTTGNGLLNALSGDLSIEAVVTTGTHLSLLASGSVLQSANVIAGSTLDLNAAAGAYTMADGATTAATGNLRGVANTSILLGGITAANIRLEAGTWIDSAGSSHVDLTADTAQLVAASFIGQAQGTANGPLQTSLDSLAATAGTGSLYLVNDQSLSVATVAAINVNRVQIDNTAPVQTGAELTGIVADQFVKLVADGDLSILAALTAVNEDLLLQALAGNLTLSASVTSGDNASILASAAINFTSTGTLDASGTLDIQASSGAITMTDGASALATGNLRMLASGDIRLSSVTAANAYLNAGGALIDNGDTGVDLVADQVQLVASGAIGQAAGTNFGLLDITASSLAVQSGGGIFIDNSAALELTSVAPIDVVRTGLDSSSTTQPGISLSGLAAAGAIILTAEGTLSIDQALVTSAAANVLLEARADTSDVNISAALTSNGGNVSIIAGRDLALTGTANLRVTAAPGTIDLLARTGRIDQAAALIIQTTNANIVLVAAVDVRLGSIEAGSGSVGITATTGSILDNKARTANLPNNITANALSMIAAGDIGRVGAGLDNAIETRVNVLAATSTVAGSIHIREFDSLLVDTVAAFSVNRVGTDNLTGTASSAMQARSDVRAAGSDGAVILRSIGTMTLNGGLAGTGATTAVAAAGSGNVLIEVLAINGDIQANAQVLADTGSISLLAGRAITLGGNANIIVASGSGTIDFNAARGNITQAASLRAETAGGNILFRARDNIQFGLVDARNEGQQSTWGLVGMIASTGSIIDAKARSGTAVNIFAAAANLSASSSIGVLGSTIDNAIETNVLILAAATTSNGAINIRQSAALTVDTVASFAVNRVSADATVGVSSTTVAARSDLRTAGNGAIVLQVTTGDLTLNGGLAGVAASEAIVASGSGSIRLETLSGSINANANILSGTGHITLVASAAIDLNANVAVATATGGNVALSALAGALAMADTASVLALGGVARLSTADDLTLASVSASSVSLIASGAITSALASGTNVTAQNLRIAASGSVGESARPLTTSVADLSALSSTGSLYITESNGVTVRDVTVSVVTFNANGTTSTVTDDAQSDLITLADGDIVLLATLGDIILQDGSNGDDIAVSADGSGTISIVAAAGALIVEADIVSGTGSITLQGTELQLGAAIRTDAAINLTATDGGISVQPGALISTGNNPLHLTTTQGIGQTGAGALNVEASALSINNTVQGSVFVNLLTAATIEGISMAGRGDLYLNQLDFDMQLNGPITVADGRIALQTRQDLTVAADLSSGRDIRLSGDTLSVGAGVSIVAAGDVLLRAQGEITFGAASSVDAGDSLSIRSGADLNIASLTAGDRMDLRAAGSIFRIDGELTAPFMRLVANGGSLGAAADELLLAAGRLDVASATGLHLIQAGDVAIGRAGLASSADLGDTISLVVENGTLTSAQGEVRFDGSGTLLLDVDGATILGAAVIAVDGNITIDTDQLSVTDAASGVILQARDGRITITSVSGIGASSGAGAQVVVAADELTATTDSGSINLVLDQAAAIIGDGVQIGSGSGTLTVAVNTGALTVNAPIRQMGSGAIDLSILNGNLWINDIIRQKSGGSLSARVHSGHLTMGLGGRVETTTGAMNLHALSNVLLSRVQSTSGFITIRSDNESVRRVASLPTSFANIISTARPTVLVDNQAFLSVDSNSVRVNTITLPRGGSQSLILVSLIF